VIFKLHYYLILILRALTRLGPYVLITRLIFLARLVITKAKTDFTVTFGLKSFKFCFVDKGAHRGGRGLFIFREQIEDLMRFGHIFLRDGDVALDIGANQGVYSLAFASAVGASGRVIAVEPMTYACEALEQNKKLNNYQNIDTYIGVVSDKNCIIKLDLSSGVGFASITRDHGGNETLKVNSITLDEIAIKYKLDRLDFIKLDIEGAEKLAINGGVNTIKRFLPVICLECENDRFNEMIALMCSFDYEPKIFNNSGNLVSCNDLNEFIRSKKNQIFFIKKTI
jgi:FkbM family methyltransferase